MSIVKKHGILSLIVGGETGLLNGGTMAKWVFLSVTALFFVCCSQLN